MASIKKALDRFDLGTPMIANMLGGEYDDGNQPEEKKIKKRPKRPQTRKRNTTMLTP